MNYCFGGGGVMTVTNAKSSAESEKFTLKIRSESGKMFVISQRSVNMMNMMNLMNLNMMNFGSGKVESAQISESSTTLQPYNFHGVFQKT